MSFDHVITIDGPAASGKTSVSRGLSAQLNWPWVTTGAFYRGLGFVAMELGVDLDDEGALSDLAVNRSVWTVALAADKTQVFFGDQDVTHLIQHEDIGALASRVSKLPAVRESLLSAQRDCLVYGKNKGGGLIAEGRDCGTVVFPKAFAKIYLTADPLQRAERRSAEQGAQVIEISQKQKRRDEQDLSRKIAPLQVADDAWIIDSTLLDLDQVIEQALSYISKRYQTLFGENLIK